MTARLKGAAALLRALAAVAHQAAAARELERRVQAPDVRLGCLGRRFDDVEALAREL